jgi:hypothetical protein
MIWNKIFLLRFRANRYNKTMRNIFPVTVSKTAILTITAIIVAAVFAISTIKSKNAEQKTPNAEYSTLSAKTSYFAPNRLTGSNKTLEKIAENTPLPAALKPATLPEIQVAIGEFAEKSGLDVFGALAPVNGALPTAEMQTPSAIPNESLPLLFPETYLAYVKTTRDWMLGRGVIQADEFTKFSTNAEILEFLPRLIDFFANEGHITETQRESFKQNIAPGFDAMKAEYLQFRSSAEAKKIASACPAPVENESSRRITEIFEKYFFGWLKEGLIALKIPVAEAFVPLCYKDWDPSGAIPGWNVPGIVCCNCGLKKIPVPPFLIFVPVCDLPVSKGGLPITPICDIPLGCLNLTCGWMPNAIWDPLTGICGCG